MEVTVRTYLSLLFILTTLVCISAELKLPNTRSPIILSSRWFHPINKNDTLSTLKMVEIFKPDRIDWMYCTDEKQLSELKKRGIKYSLALNAQVPDSGEYTVNGRIKDIEGNSLLAPWMKNWKQKNPYWGCVNNPTFQKTFLEKSYQLVNLGAYGLFVDDSRLNEQATDWGGCMCEFCIKGFTSYMNRIAPGKVATEFNYKNFLLENGFTKSSFIEKKNIPYWEEFKNYQEESVMVFLKKWKEAVRKIGNKEIIFLTNNYKGSWSKIYSQFNIGIAEIPADGLNNSFIRDGVNTAKKLNKQQFYTFSSDNEEDNVKAVLDVYQAGSSLVIPWDVYVDLKSRQTPTRYFGDPALYGPLYKLLQNNAVIDEIKVDNSHNQSSNQLLALKLNKNSKQNYSPRVVKIEFEKKNRTNTVQIENSKVSVLYPHESNVVIKTELNRTRIDTKSKVLVLTYE